MASDSQAAAPAQVCGAFHDRARLNEAMSKLEGKRFQRADLAIRESGNDVPGAVGDATPVREDDARNLRQLGVGRAAAGLGLGEAMAPDDQAERILRESGAARVWLAGPPGGA